MTEFELPDAIQAFIGTTNAGDPAGFITAFTSDAYLNDWGREFHGHDSIRSWDRSDNIGVHAHFELVAFEAGDAPGSYIVTLTVTGDGYNGTGTMRFELRDGLIHRLIIS